MVGERRYRFSVDDNILFLKDLATSPEKYPSLLDHPYLKFWSTMHQKYGTKFHFNIYFQTEGFNLTEMPDIWKKEWKLLSPWLNLSFHAFQDQPPNPYKKASYETVKADYLRVVNEIKRFAGEEVITDTTTLHWCEATVQGVRALKDCGINILIGLFADNRSGSYHLTPDQIQEINKKWVWTDDQIGMTFIRCTSVVNTLKMKEIPKELERRTHPEPKNKFAELLIHEQYFRPDTRFYQRNIKKKVQSALEWMTKAGYTPVFWTGNTI